MHVSLYICMYLSMYVDTHKNIICRYTHTYTYIHAHNSPYIDQDEALYITRKARKFRAKLSALGMMKFHTSESNETQTGQNSGGGGTDAENNAGVLEMAGAMFNVRDAWLRCVCMYVCMCACMYVCVCVYEPCLMCATLG